MAQKIAENLKHLARNFDLVFVALCFAVQFIVITSDLPRGFESGKLLGFSIVILIGLVFLAGKVLYAPASLFVNLKPGQWLFILAGTSISLGFAILATILSPYPQIALHGNFFRGTGLVFFGQLHVLFILIILIARKENLLRYLQLFLAVTMLQLPLVVANIWVLNSLEEFLSGYFVGGSFGQSNFLAGQLVSAFLISGGLFLIHARRRIYLLCAIVFAAMTLVTLSYAGILFLLIIPVLAILIWKIKISFMSSYPIVFLIITVTILAGSTFVWKTDEARNIYATAALELIADRPFSGYGLDSFREGSSQIGLQDRNVDRVHHMFLDVSYSLGLPLALSAFTFLISTVALGGSKKNHWVFLFSLPVLVFLIATVVHTRSSYHYLELSLFLGVWLVTYLGSDS